MSKRVAIIGAGISGISCANMLKSKGFNTQVYEKNKQIGGLIRCTREDGFLFHRVGGHVFNTKDKKVDNWFWSHFSKTDEFTSAIRKAGILIDGLYIDYPIENNIYQLKRDVTQRIIEEIVGNRQNKSNQYANLSDFFQLTFGKTLYELYFRPYNEKIWQMNLEKMPLEWLDGKLPMPDTLDILMSNIYRLTEDKMVHASFYYPKHGGSQFIIDRLSTDINIIKNYDITNIGRDKKTGSWIVDETTYDILVFTGDIRTLRSLLPEDVSSSISHDLEELTWLKSNGTSNLLCKCARSDYSWIYLPERQFKAHRIINTGNFSESNNSSSMENSCVVEFSGKYTHDEMCREAKLLPGSLIPMASNYEQNSYVVHTATTKKVVDKVKQFLKDRSLYLCGRFAEWEYYNMDTAILAAMDVSDQIEMRHQ